MENDDFYSPLSISGYLTPLQRKKLKAKRCFSMFTNSETDFKTPKRLKSMTKPLRQSETKPKVGSIKSTYHRSKSVESLPQVRCTAAELLGKDKTPNSSYKAKRFFKSRSPRHFEKASYVMHLTYKKRSLDFALDKKDAKSYLKSVENSLPAPLVELNINPENFVDGQSEDENVLVDKGKSLVKSKTYEALQGEKTPIGPNSHLEYNNTPKSKDSVQIPTIVKLLKRSIISDLFEVDEPTQEELFKRQNKARALSQESLLSSAEKTLEESDIVEGNKITPPKCYPIFISKKQQSQVPTSKRTHVQRSFCTKDTAKSGEQMIIDAGQKEIGAQCCRKCDMFYTLGQEEDERLHSNFHHKLPGNLKFSGWKAEEFVEEYADGRVIQVDMNEYKDSQYKKIEKILSIADRDLGCDSIELPQRPNVKVLLFLSNDKTVNGCLVAESIESANPVVLVSKRDECMTGDDNSAWKLDNWCASEETVPAICGVNRIWVSQQFRRQKVASRMLDCLRKIFVGGFHEVSKQELAFTDPSPDGRQFAVTYTGTTNFLVYK